MSNLSSFLSIAVPLIGLCWGLKTIYQSVYSNNNNSNNSTISNAAVIKSSLRRASTLANGVNNNDNNNLTNTNTTDNNTLISTPIKSHSTDNNTSTAASTPASAAAATAITPKSIARTPQSQSQSQSTIQSPSSIASSIPTSIGSNPNAAYRIAIVSPITLTNYSNQLMDGFNQLISNNYEQYNNSILIDNLLPIDNSNIAIIELIELLFTRQYNILLVQLHGSQQELPVVFELAKSLQLLINHQSKSIPKLFLLIHRPEEVFERHWQRYYNSQQSIHTVLSLSTVTILLGSAHRSVYNNFCRTNIIPHGYYNLTTDRTNIELSKSINLIGCIGSVTTWSDMRWISDVVQLHRSYINYRNNNNNSTTDSDNDSTATDPKLLFYIAGKYQSYEQSVSKLTVDELALIRTLLANDNTSISINLIESSIIEYDYTVNKLFNSAINYKSYLYNKYSMNGNKIVLINGSFKSIKLQLIQSQLIDFNIQLYRELLCDYKPKIEYSGTLHESIGYNIPIVFQSLSMQDLIDNEGMYCITVKPNQTNINYSLAQKTPNKSASAVSASASATDPAAVASYGFFYPASYYPDYNPTIKLIIDYQLNQSKFDQDRLKFWESAQKLQFNTIAGKYIELFDREFKQ